MDFPEKLRQTRISKGKKQKEVAEFLNITTSTYCGYETGKRQPSMAKLRKIAEFLEVSISDLLWQGEGPPKEPSRVVVTPHGIYLANDNILDEIDIGFYGDYKALTEDDKAVLREMARVMLERRQKNTPQD